jgi:hypothetical protein
MSHIHNQEYHEISTEISDNLSPMEEDNKNTCHIELCNCRKCGEDFRNDTLKKPGKMMILTSLWLAIMIIGIVIITRYCSPIDNGGLWTIALLIVMISGILFVAFLISSIMVYYEKYKCIKCYEKNDGTTGIYFRCSKICGINKMKEDDFRDQLIEKQTQES